MTEQESGSKQWRWRYSMLTGVMYSPIPVGIIVVVICFIVYYAFFS